ncbi:MAG: carboxymuconolactone decarboxylase family protein [Bacteroidota bacterium]|nr:carboxymuconolactone decarboxylase family protein [Bacteroidota bacterium]MDP4234040.1 carboxymuconolactone decarboxylase family protein [Bacteroidota bacterium]MDP4242906.1 carboxymuconolactone decarboxylase family protein [Bacteroidota bacterium]MDP4287655.1 carboxymuconolactone decarboxylase family protein [Bacteroidota bacterium]
MRFDYKRANPEASAAMLAFNRFSHETKLDAKLIELIKIRASQINGCAFCLDMHTRDALALGESDRRLHVLAVWQESGMFSEREQVALRLTEAVTRISKRGVPDDLYAAVRTHFDEREYMDLISVINIINCWNRIAIATGLGPPEKA